MHRLLCLVFLFCAVAASARVARPNLTNHVIAANYDGLAVHPMTEEIFPTPEAFRDFVDLMLGNAETLAVEKGERSEDGRIKVKILIHVHGGLNLREHTTKRVETLSDTIKNEKVDWYYPIFVRWPSSFGSTYWEHLTSIRQGNKSPLWGPATMPVVLVTDTIQFIGHAPVDWFYQTVNTKDRMMSRFGWDCMLSENWEIALSNRDQPNVRWSGYYRTTGDSLKNTVLGIVGFPVRVTLGNLGQGTIAQASWNNMKRRTSQIVHPAPLFSQTEEHDAWRKKAAGEFFNILNERATTRTAEPSLFKYELYFVGHSMGAMVLNKIFTQYRREWIESRSVNRIVYMAAACSIGDGLEAIKPLLIAYNTNGVPLRFHNLTLNRVAEIAERSMWGVAPTGSLLEYIDQHLENPDAAINRTMGSEVNILTAIHLFDEVENYCEFKGFDRDPRRIPAAHSDFNLCPFWWPSFWSVATEVSPGRNNYPKNWIKVHPAAKELPLQQQPAQAK